MGRIFISHSKKDVDKAQHLAQLLSVNGVDVWFDDWEILVGHNIYDSVYEAILASDYLAMVITKQSLGSRWVKEELGLMRQRELEERDVRILPLLFEDVELPLNLRAVKYADFRDFDHGFAHLMRTLGQASTLIDGRILEDIRNAVQSEGLASVSATKEVRSQAANRLLRGTLGRVSADASSAGEFVSIEVDFRSAGTVLPLKVPIDERSGVTLRRVLNLLDMDAAAQGQRMSYFLIHDGHPIAADKTLREAGVHTGTVLQIGYYTYAIE